MADLALDENRAVLARMSEQGDDLTKARDIEFVHVFESQDGAEVFSAWATQSGYVVECFDDGKIHVIVRHHMAPELRALTALENTLGSAAREFGGCPDGWGCYAVPNFSS